MISATALAELIGRRVQLKQVGKTTWLGQCPKHRCAQPHFHVFDFDGHGMFKCHSGECGWSGNEVTWRSFIGETPREPTAAEREATRQRLREQALQRQADQRIAALLNSHPDAPPEAEMFGRDALHEWMTKRLGWKS